MFSRLRIPILENELPLKEPQNQASTSVANSKYLTVSRDANMWSKCSTFFTLKVLREKLCRTLSLSFAILISRKSSKRPKNRKPTLKWKISVTICARF